MATILTPTALLHLVLALGIVNLWRKHKESRRRLLWVAVPFLLLTVIGTDPVAYVALGTVEWPYPPSNEVPEDAGAIVVLAGSVRSPDRVLTQPELGPGTLYRCLQALALHRKAKDRPILVSGGSADGVGSLAAEVMRDFLVTYGVQPANVIVEGRSQNTYENAVESCRLLRERGVRRIVLVTEAAHMARASACFRKQGMEVAPSPCRHRANEYSPGWKDLWPDVIPNVSNAAEVTEAWHEWIGLLVYWIRGRL